MIYQKRSYYSCTTGGNAREVNLLTTCVMLVILHLFTLRSAGMETLLARWH